MLLFVVLISVLLDRITAHPYYQYDPCSNLYSNSGVLLANQDNCAQYYDCSSPVGQTVECSFPNLFSTRTGQCEDKSQVNCGSRYEPTDACEYEGNQCTTETCIPCNVRFPTCSGLEDGVNAWRGRIWSPFHVECYGRRVIETRQCPNGFVFSPVELKCISLK